ncbi:unnamed protein product [Ostreobium quekettii]|uniref:Aminotransferase class I/classII large domain-containing protein n=1 Tax=Ostreobium quekettii TaxID=121088 RepID=A0A8S1IXL1_9CHLO|nr:unnamed protein product [Ostreobium quekettii]
MRSAGTNGFLFVRPGLRCQKPVGALTMPDRGAHGTARAVQGDPGAAVGISDTHNGAGSENGCVDMRLNPCVEAVKTSRTVEITGLAQALREEGKDVISLAAGEPDFATPDSIVAAGIEAMTQGITKYTQNAGTSQLRKAVCQKLQADNGLEYTPDCIVLSNGAKQSVWQGVMATCGAGDEVGADPDSCPILGELP